MGSRLFIGLMSGSSCDALDAVLLRIDDGPAPRWEVVRSATSAYEPAFRGRLLGLGPGTAPGELDALDGELARRSARLVGRLLREAGIAPGDVAAIGSHGHTAYHISPPLSDVVRTRQIGDGGEISRLTRIVTVWDFRASDVARGGQGAPLVPAADAVLFARHVPPEGLLLLNLGGIANLTFLPAKKTARLAFDTGPGNMVADALARRASGGRLACDADGKLAAGGAVVPEILDYWLELPFFSLPPPRTASREDFGEAFVTETLRRFPGHGWPDLLRTAVELTALSIRDAVSARVLGGPAAGASPPLWAAGGGVLNPVLLGRLRDSLGEVGVTVDVLEDRVALASKDREAAAFAVLARETLAGRAGNWPEATGAAGPAVLGRTSRPA